jgi:hypothetical protein
MRSFDVIRSLPGPKAIAYHAAEREVRIQVAIQGIMLTLLVKRLDSSLLDIYLCR